jgi:tetraacyldisaccharide 4'-kinase
MPTKATLLLALQRALVQAWTRRGLMAWLLWPISLIFGLLAALRRGLYKIGLYKTQKLSVPVIVVGNVVVGGSGKTPVVMAIVKHLQSSGIRVGVISRGYGRLAMDCREVLVDSAIREVGDEPALIKRATSAPVFVASSRFEAGSALLATHPTIQVILCDDGLQHLSLHRDLEICVFDDRGIGNGFLLPAGPLREAWPRSAELVLHTGSRPAFSGFKARRELARRAIRADGSQVELSDLTLQFPNAKPLLAIAAIAKPEEFFSMLRSLGLKLAHTISLPDHYDFNSVSSNDYRGYSVICTEKDAVKLWHKLPTALAVPLEFTPESAFFVRLDNLLSAVLASP